MFDSIGMALQDALDDLISQNLIEPQLAMKICSNYDKAFAELIAERVKSRLNFKVRLVRPFEALSNILTTRSTGKP